MWEIKYYEKKCYYNNENIIQKVEKNLIRHEFNAKIIPLVGDIIRFDNKFFVVKNRIIPYPSLKFYYIELIKYNGPPLVMEMEQDIWYPEYTKK